MKREITMTMWRVRALVLAALGSLAIGSAQAAPGDVVATITHLSGILSVKHPDGSVKILSVKSQVVEGDVLTTEKEAYARMKFVDNSEVVLRPNTTMAITAFTYRENDPKADRVQLDMLKGGFRAVSGLLGKRSREAVSYGTPTATIGIRGTHVGALHCDNNCQGVPTPTGRTPDNGLHVDVAAGAVIVTPSLTMPLPGAGGTPGAPNSPNSPNPSPQQGGPQPGVILNAGQFGYLPPPQNGVQPPLVLVPPNQAVQVRMPASISQNNPQQGATNKSGDPECVVQ